MESKSKKLRSGYTTGACAAAAAKAATSLLLRNSPSPHPFSASGEGVFHPLPSEGEERGEGAVILQTVKIPFPDGSRVTFKVHSSEFRVEGAQNVATASVIKDAGDDPDVTHGAEIVATVQCSPCARVNTRKRWVQAEFRVQSVESYKVVIKGGEGVGRMTKPGLAIPVGEPAINPVPRKMILDAVLEAVRELQGTCVASEREQNSELQTLNSELIFDVTISVPAGEELAKKTLNHRLGIVGGISILGTTGIVRPVSTEAYTASITASMDVAKAAGLSVVVLSSGRTSEKAHMKKFHFPEEAYVMMGDYLEFALRDAKAHGFTAIHLCAQWAKMIKAAMGTPQTHVRHGALETKRAADFIADLGIAISRDRLFNTTREIFECIQAASPHQQSAMEMVCEATKHYVEGLTSGISVIVHLVSYEGDILAASE